MIILVLKTQQPKYWNKKEKFSINSLIQVSQKFPIIQLKVTTLKTKHLNFLQKNLIRNILKKIFIKFKNIDLLNNLRSMFHYSYNNELSTKKFWQIIVRETRLFLINKLQENKAHLIIDHYNLQKNKISAHLVTIMEFIKDLH